MRVVLVTAVLALAGCGQHASLRPACSLRLGPEVPERTGEHSLPLATSCALETTPLVDLGLPFTYVAEGGPKGSHVVVLDKYRCDIRAQAVAHVVVMSGARLELGRTLMDWCPAQAVSSVIHVYLGSVHRRASWRGVFSDAYDGRLDRVYPCGVLRDAIAHFPSSPPAYSPLPARVGRAAASACASALGGIARDAPRTAVVEALGAPTSTGARCAVWRWRPYAGAVDGARVCFARGRATLVQTAVHGRARDAAGACGGAPGTCSSLRGDPARWLYPHVGRRLRLRREDRGDPDLRRRLHPRVAGCAAAATTAARRALPECCAVRARGASAEAA